jgi:DNA-binding response OmpR family regulator
LRFSKANDADLILLDIMMPGMDGFAVLDALRADRRLASIPVLVISGMDGDMQSVARAIELGATDFLPKEFNADPLQGARRVLHREKAPARR